MQTPIDSLEKYRVVFPKVNEDHSEEEISEMIVQNKEFRAFLQNSAKMLDKARQKMREMEIQHDRMQKSYLGIYKAYMKYEDIAVDYFADSDVDKRILTHPAAAAIDQAVVDAYGPYKFKNPYREAYTWIKGELLDTKGMLDAFTSFENVLNARKKLIQKRREDMEELEKLNTNQTSLRNFFRSTENKTKQKEILTAAIEDDEAGIEHYNRLINFIAILNSQIVIAMFKSNKVV